MANIRMLLGLSLAALHATGPAQGAAQRYGTAAPDEEQSIQLFEAAGFRVEKRARDQPLRRRVEPARRLCRSQRRRAGGACRRRRSQMLWQAAGAYFAVLTLGTDGRWPPDRRGRHRRLRQDAHRRLARPDARGAIRPAPARHFAAGSYGAPTASAPVARPQPCRQAQRRRVAASMPISRDYLLDWDGSQTPEAKALPASKPRAVPRCRDQAGQGQPLDRLPKRRQRPFAGAGRFYRRRQRRRPTRSDDPRQWHLLQRIGGRQFGRPDQNAGGKLESDAATQGFANFLKSHGVDNYPDIQVEDFPVSASPICAGTAANMISPPGSTTTASPASRSDRGVQPAPNNPRVCARPQADDQEQRRGDHPDLVQIDALEQFVTKKITGTLAIIIPSVVPAVTVKTSWKRAPRARLSRPASCRPSRRGRRR